MPWMAGEGGKQPAAGNPPVAAPGVAPCPPTTAVLLTGELTRETTPTDAELTPKGSDADTPPPEWFTPPGEAEANQASSRRGGGGGSRRSAVEASRRKKRPLHDERKDFWRQLEATRVRHSFASTREYRHFRLLQVEQASSLEGWEAAAPTQG